MKRNVSLITAFALVICILPLKSCAQMLTTFAGNGIFDTIVNGVAATSTTLGFPRAVTADKSGNVYIGDIRYHCIRKVDVAGIITTIAGVGAPGFSGDNGPATNASLNYPNAMCVDDTGNVYVVDNQNLCIRMINRYGIITTFAGTPTVLGYSGDSGPATAATLYFPSGVAADHKGNVYIADRYNHVIRKVHAGIISTFAGTGAIGFSGDNGPASAARLSKPWSVAVDDIGNVYIGDSMSFVRKVDTFGTITTIAGLGGYGLCGDEGAALSACIRSAISIAADRYGHIFILDGGNYAVRLVNPGGIITRYTGDYTSGYNGDNQPAVVAKLNAPKGICVDTAGTLYIADEVNYRIRKVLRDPTAIKNIGEPLGDIDIFPNPSKGSFTLTLSSAQNNNATVVMYDMCGRCIASRDNCSNNQVFELNCAAGVYIVEVRANGQVVRKRLEIL